MTRTFLVAVELSPSDSPDAFADTIHESLSSDGIPVSSVKPWSSPGVGMGALPTIEIPPTQL